MPNIFTCVKTTWLTLFLALQVKSRCWNWAYKSLECLFCSLWTVGEASASLNDKCSFAALLGYASSQLNDVAGNSDQIKPTNSSNLKQTRATLPRYFRMWQDRSREMVWRSGWTFIDCSVYMYSVCKTVYAKDNVFHVPYYQTISESVSFCRRVPFVLHRYFLVKYIYLLY